MSAVIGLGPPIGTVMIPGAGCGAGTTESATLPNVISGAAGGVGSSEAPPSPIGNMIIPGTPESLVGTPTSPKSGVTGTSLIPVGPAKDSSDAHSLAGASCAATCSTDVSETGAPYST